MQADEASLEEIAQSHGLSQAVVVGIADDEPRKDEEEIYGQVAVVDDSDDSAAGGKRQSLENVVEHHQQGSYPAQPVQQLVVGLGVRVGSGRRP